MPHEIPFESLNGQFEATRGTAVDATPTFRLNMEGTINPQLMIAAPPAHVGILAGNAGTEVVREWSTIEGEGPLDTRTAPMMCAMVLDGTIGAGSIVGAGPAYTFDVARHMTADNLKSATWWWGDASSGDIYKALYGMIDEWTIENDVTSDDGARMGIAGTAKEMDDIAPPALAAVGLAPIMVGKNIQVWIDAYSGTIGTTEVTNRVLGATHTIPRNRTRRRCLLYRNRARYHRTAKHAKVSRKRRPCRVGQVPGEGPLQVPGSAQRPRNRDYQPPLCTGAVHRPLG
jgi:xanthosine utilization system XapX-like protein